METKRVGYPSEAAVNPTLRKTGEGWGTQIRCNLMEANRVGYPSESAVNPTLRKTGEG